MQKTTLQIMIGLALIAPAGLMAIRDGKLDLEPTSLPIVLQPVEAVASAEKQTVAVASLYADKFDIPLSLAQDIHLAARVNGISPKVAFGLVRAESSFRPAATSPVGAVGLTQLMPATARMFKPGVTRTQLKRPETNLNIGFRYLRELIDRYNGNEKLALTAFNRGPGTVDKLLKHGRNPDNGYAEKVLTGKSSRHVALMNAKFGHKRRRHRG